MRILGSIKAPIEHCPHCDSSHGYYVKERVYGSVRYNYHFDGSEAENGDMYEYLSYKGGKVAYCSECHKKLFNVSDLK